MRPAVALPGCTVYMHAVNTMLHAYWCAQPVMSKSRATGRESFSVFVMSGQSWIIRNMKLALLAATLASVLFCGWSGPIDVGNALHPALSHDQLKGIGRLLRVDPAIAVIDWECSTCKILFTELQNLFLKNATDEKIIAHITEFCIKLKIEDKLVCTAIVTEFKVI